MDEYTLNYAIKNTEDTMIMNVNPEDLEASAAHAMARAAEIRAIDALEPTGEQPVISWEWTPDSDTGVVYSYIALKANDGCWYPTGGTIAKRLTWRNLCEQPKAKALREGNFLICTEWSLQEDVDR